MNRAVRACERPGPFFNGISDPGDFYFGQIRQYRKVKFGYYLAGAYDPDGVDAFIGRITFALWALSFADQVVQPAKSRFSRHARPWFDSIEHPPDAVLS